VERAKRKRFLTLPVFRQHSYPCVQRRARLLAAELFSRSEAVTLYLGDSTSPSKAIQLSEKDLKLIQELGLDNVFSFESVHEKISLLNMRQLYRLKLLFLRISSEEACFSEAILTGIQHNELQSYSEAYVSLSKARGLAEDTAATEDKA